MAKKQKKNRATRRRAAEQGNFSQQPTFKEVPVYERKPIKALNTLQERYINSIKNRVITVCTGVPGSGKTFLPAQIAIDMFDDPSNNIESIVLVRPNVALGPSIGFLKGDKLEKMRPWLVPLEGPIVSRIGKGKYEYLVGAEKIDFLPVEYARGRTFNNAFVIIDEAQNLGVEAMRALLTRVGKDCRVVICGDVQQCDLNNGTTSGLSFLQELSEEFNVPYNWIDFNSYDYCVRSDEVKFLLETFDEYDQWVSEGKPEVPVEAANEWDIEVPAVVGIYD